MQIYEVLKGGGVVRDMREQFGISVNDVVNGICKEEIIYIVWR